MTKESTFPLLPLKDMVVYPGIVHHLAVGRPKSLAALTAAAESGRELITVAQLDATVSEPGIEALHPIGTVARINRVEKHKQGAQVIVQGVRRVRLAADCGEPDYLGVTYTELPVISVDEDADDAPERKLMNRADHPPAFLRSLEEFERLSARRGERLLDQQVRAGFERTPAELGV